MLRQFSLYYFYLIEFDAIENKNELPRKIATRIEKKVLLTSKLSVVLQKFPVIYEELQNVK